MSKRNPFINKKVPCYECTKRRPGCHATCKEYLIFYKKQRKKNDDLRKETIESVAIHKSHLNRRFHMTTTGKRMTGREFYYRGHVGQNKK